MEYRNTNMEKEFEILAELGVDADEIAFLQHERNKQEIADRWD